MLRWRLTLVLASAVALGACGASHNASPPQHVRTRDEPATTAPDVVEPSTVVVSIPPTTDLTTTTTTARPTTTTTRPAAPPSTTSTTAAPSTTTTTAPAGPDGSHFRLTLENTYAAAVAVHVGSATSNDWTLQPGQKAGPVDIGTAPHDGASVARADDPACGAADAGGYFTGGHTYRIVVDTRSTSCADGPGPRLTIEDLTTGTTATI